MKSCVNDIYWQKCAQSPRAVADGCRFSSLNDKGATRFHAQEDLPRPELSSSFQLLACLDASTIALFHHPPLFLSVYCCLRHVFGQNHDCNF